MDAEGTISESLLIETVEPVLPAGTRVNSARLHDAYVRSTQITHWELHYSARVDVPSRLVAKTSLRPEDAGSAVREAEFYRKAHAAGCSGLLPRLIGCRSAQNSTLLVLEDVSPGFAPAISGPCQNPSLPVNRAVFASIGAIHAAFWGDASLATFPVEILSSRLSAMLEKKRDVIVANLASRPHASQDVQLLSMLIAELPGIQRNVLSRTAGLTIIHGDFHPGNVLVSREQHPVRAMIIDWPNWQPGTPADDLAYYLCLCLPPQDRQAQERELLHHYYSSLPARIQSEYSWEQLIDDYRVSIMRCLAVALLWIAVPSPAQWAWSSLEFAIEAHREFYQAPS